MRLRDYMRYLGWSNAELARQASINKMTVGKALRGATIRPFVAQKIAKALTKALETPVMPGDIEDLHVER